MEGAAIAKTEGCDFIIALGGGSTIDASKAISVMATNPGDYWDYVRAGSCKGQPITVKPLPVVAISTTSGTGSETDPWAVISNEERGEKVGYGGDLMYPVMSIFDPELTPRVLMRCSIAQKVASIALPMRFPTSSPWKPCD